MSYGLSFMVYVLGLSFKVIFIIDNCFIGYGIKKFLVYIVWFMVLIFMEYVIFAMA